MTDTIEITDTLNRLIAAAHRQRAAAAATRADLNATDLLAIDIVRRHDGISPGTLAREMHLTPGGTNGVIRRAIKARMLTRTVSPDDRRNVTLHTTPRGQHLTTTGTAGWDPDLLTTLTHLPEPHLTTLLTQLDHIATTTEHRADQLTTTAAAVNDPTTHIPLPVRWG